MVPDMFYSKKTKEACPQLCAVRITKLTGEDVDKELEEFAKYRSTRRELRTARSYVPRAHLDNYDSDGDPETKSSRLRKGPRIKRRYRSPSPPGPREPMDLRTTRNYLPADMVDSDDDDKGETFTLDSEVSSDDNSVDSVEMRKRRAAKKRRRSPPLYKPTLTEDEKKLLDKRSNSIKENKAMLAKLMADLEPLPLEKLTKKKKGGRGRPPGKAKPLLEFNEPAKPTRTVGRPRKKINYNDDKSDTEDEMVESDIEKNWTSPAKSSKSRGRQKHDGKSETEDEKAETDEEKAGSDDGKDGTIPVEQCNEPATPRKTIRLGRPNKRPQADNQKTEAETDDEKDGTSPAKSPKKRGRPSPKKIINCSSETEDAKEGNSPEEQPATPRKGRGSPKKEPRTPNRKIGAGTDDGKAESDDDWAPSSPVKQTNKRAKPPKKRGRPKKEQQTKIGGETDEEKEETSPPKKEGRPKKWVFIGEKEPDDDWSPPYPVKQTNKPAKPPKKKGRPKKEPQTPNQKIGAETDDEKAESEDEKEGSTPVKQTSESAKPPKKRGRPKKAETEDAKEGNSPEEQSKETATPPKARGRPKKVLNCSDKAETEEGQAENDHAKEGNSPEEQCNKSAKPPKARGRPKKVPHIDNKKIEVEPEVKAETEDAKAEREDAKAETEDAKAETEDAKAETEDAMDGNSAEGQC